MSRTIRRFAAALLVALCLCVATPPASATNPYQLYTGTVTASGQSAAYAIRTNTMGWVTVNITAASGTIALDMWLEGSNDDGVTWFEIANNGTMLTSGAAAENSPSSAGRPIIDNRTSTSAAKYSAAYNFLPMTKIRLAWTLSGSSPSVTFDARFGGK